MKRKLIFIIVALSLLYWIMRVLLTPEPVISPCPDTGCSATSSATLNGTMGKIVPKVQAAAPDGEQIDAWVHKYAMKYGKTKWAQNRTKVILHFLLLREQNYGGSTNCGDSGKACGPLQFHETTYNEYRTIMFDDYLVTHIGSRLDMEDAIETAAWAINNGRENAWGPIARGEITL